MTACSPSGVSMLMEMAEDRNRKPRENIPTKSSTPKMAPAVWSSVYPWKNRTPMTRPKHNDHNLNERFSDAGETNAHYNVISGHGTGQEFPHKPPVLVEEQSDASK